MKFEHEVRLDRKEIKCRMSGLTLRERNKDGERMEPVGLVTDYKG